MLDEARSRTATFQARLKEAGHRVAILTDESSIAYLAGFWGYLGIEFGRPTMLVLRADAAPIIVTPLMETEMVSTMTWVDDVRSWEDAGPDHWSAILANAIGEPAPREIAVETRMLPAIVHDFFAERYPDAKLRDVSPLLGEQRMIKSPLEIGVMRQAGAIAAAMMDGARNAMDAGVPEYEVALAVMNAGTRKAAGFLTGKGWEAFVSPMIHNLQIIQSGADTSMVHRRASVKPLDPGDPVYLCFCNMVQFKQYKLGFDRQFFIHHVSDEAAHVQETAVRAQQTALKSMRAGVTAESVAAAANAVYRENGFSPGYRTGRSIGVAYLEAPELKEGDKTILRPGMTFAVDGGVTVEGKFGGRIGDSVVVTETGFDYLTNYPRELAVLQPRSAR
ncbi:MAG: Xaa-Pro peptidase family protein [Rhodospirillaceae bacterium]|nr:Xaa-Pro peptidase family protein [Rhodospirillaceae bacterium]